MVDLIETEFSSVFAKMDKTCDFITQGILDIFSIFSLGMRSKSLSVLQFGLLFFNLVIPLSITVSYVASGKLTISSDALSKATDVFELFNPTFIHLFVICRNLKNQKVFNQIHSLIDFFDEKFQTLDSTQFKGAKNSAILFFGLKFLTIHVIGLGIDSFMLITLYPGNILWQNAIRTRVISLNVLRLMSSQFIFYCDYFTSRMTCFNNELKKISNNKKIDENEFLEKLQFLKALDLKLTELLLLVNEYFKWMLLLNIASDLIIVVIDIYWIYGGFLFGDNPYFLRKPFDLFKSSTILSNSFKSKSNFRIKHDPVWKNNSHDFGFFVWWQGSGRKREIAGAYPRVQTKITSCGRIKTTLLATKTSHVSLPIRWKWIFLDKLCNFGWGTYDSNVT